MQCILPEVQPFRMPFDTEELNSCCSPLFKRPHELGEAIETHTSLARAALCGLSDIYEAVNCTSGSTKRYLINKHIRLSVLETLPPCLLMLYGDVFSFSAYIYSSDAYYECEMMNIIGFLRRNKRMSKLCDLEHCYA